MEVMCKCAYCKKLFVPDLMESISIGGNEWEICSLCAYQFTERLKNEWEVIDEQEEYLLDMAKRAIEHPEEFPVEVFPTYKPPSNLKYFGHDYD